MEHLEDDKLQRYFDGELTDGEARVVSNTIADSSDEQKRLKQLERLSGVMRYAEDVADDLNPDDLFASIQEGIDSAPNPRLQVIEGAKKKQRAGTALGIAIAIAAAVALAWFLKPPAETEIAEPETTPEVEIEDGHMVIPEGDDLEVFGSEVVRVEFGDVTGTVFEVEGDHGQPLAVVWINDEEDT